MTTGFTRHRRSKAMVASFSAFEADLLRSLAGQLVELLRNEAAMPPDEHEDPSSPDALEAMLAGIDGSGPTAAPEDPVLARLFPTAYDEPQDEEAAGDFRRFTEQSLRDGKARAAAAVIDTLEESGLPDNPPDGMFIDVELDAPQAQTWLRAFNDMRLAIGTRLEVTDGDEDVWESLPEDDPRAPVHEIYDWLGFVQETLVRALMR
ncbi:hypothetical protein GCM10011519_34240 [Marmoricola endophyticus]|uniref:DUF2017 domain-containing protein n=1 Tax=Marmoricola endophyticus TaxID=2040280 RepID=A0A917FAD4_9ACTN|nr:DUF2017 domain-containing protein [Marmoricola endophyticus]GGF57435.1 hypothetical protein GCM10011519_34240 [Marmoricola endophyticus]